MCTAVRDGGRRCPLHQHVSQAFISLAAHESGLQTSQVQNLFRELRREGNGSGSMSERAFDELTTNASVAATANNVTRFEDQLNRAVTVGEETDGQTDYALIRIRERAQERGQTLNVALQAVADRTGYTLEEIKEKYATEYNGVDTRRGTETPPEFTPRTRQQNVRAGLPYDQASVVALARIQALETASEQVRRVTEWHSLNSSMLNQVGYHEGRLEVQFHGNDNTYAYQNVPQSLWERLISAQRPGSVYNGIRGNSEFTYESAEAAEADAHALRCRSCGQFRAAVHSCPERATREALIAAGVPTSEVQSRLDAGETVEQATANASTETWSPSTTSATSEAVTAIVSDAGFQERLPFATTETVEINGTTRHVISLGNTLTERNTFRSQNGSMGNRRPSAFTRAFADPENPTSDELYQLMETSAAWDSLQNVTTLHYINVVRDNLHNADFTIPVEANFTSTRSLREMHSHRAGVVTGEITIARLNEGERLEDATTYAHQLRCTCPDYAENYDCIHIRAAVRNPYVFLANRSRQFVEGEALPTYLSRHRNALDVERNVRNRMLNSGVSREDALAQAQEEEAERQRQAEEQAAYRRASQAERERINMERGVRAAELAQRRNSTVVEENAQYRERMQARWENPDEGGYSSNMDAFYEEYQATLRRKRSDDEETLDFLTENVTDGICSNEPGGRAFGVEIEFDIESGRNRGAALEAIAHELHEAGLTETAYQQEYHSARASGWAAWSFEQDCTVSGELVSPIMKDTPEHWQQLSKALEIIKRHGGVATRRTGSHVHISTASYESSPAKHLELLRQVNRNDELMYRLGTNPERGTHRGMEWCAPNVNDTSDVVSADVSSTHHVLGAHTSHGYGMNFEGTYSDNYSRSNIEFRMWDATLDAAVIQRQVMISAAMTDYAERNVINEGQSRPLTAEERPTFGDRRRAERESLGTRRSHTRETFEQNAGNAPEFIDNLFRRQEDRQRIAQLFAVTNWQTRN